MKIGEVRYLESEKKLALPAWVGLLPAGLQERYILKKKPFTITEEQDVLHGVLSVPLGNGLSQAWRSKAEEMLRQMEAADVAIIVPPQFGELPQEILPIAYGGVLTALFAFAGAGEALRRQGKNPQEAQYLLAGGQAAQLRRVLAGLGGDVNRLSFFGDAFPELGTMQEKLYEESGLLLTHTASRKSPLLAEADAVIICGMEQTGFEHILKRYAVVIDAAGNRPVLRRLMERRWDVAAAEGFYFTVAEGEAQEGKWAEALAYTTLPEFRRLWQWETTFIEESLAFTALQTAGFRIKGFSALGKRVKIQKNQG